MKKWSLSVLLLVLTFHLSAQMIHPIVGTYNKKSAQGMAIWDNYAYLFNDGGHCRVIDLESGVTIREFDLACSEMNPHINNASFGKEKTADSELPFVYVSETDKPHRCFVENISGDQPTLVQIIEAKEKGKLYPNHNWVVDRDSNYLYGINRRWHDYLDEEGNVKNYVTKYNLPQINEGKFITLSEKDVVDRFEVIFASVMQDAVIKGCMMYILTGYHEMAHGKKGAKRALIIIDLEKKKIDKYIDLTYLTTNEPEGVDFWNTKCFIFCGQNGGLYEKQF